jgi:hypothetical protein
MNTRVEAAYEEIDYEMYEIDYKGALCSLPETDLIIQVYDDMDQYVLDDIVRLLNIAADKELSIPRILLYKWNETTHRYHRNDLKQIQSSLSRYIKCPYKELLRYEMDEYNSVFIKPLSARVLKNRDIFIHYDTDYSYHVDVDVDVDSDDEESNKIPIESYNGRQLKDYYYDCEEDAFYCYKDNEYKELIPKMQRDGTEYVYMYDVNGYRFKLCIKKFKKLHNLN